jgi:hypothetical protein
MIILHLQSNHGYEKMKMTNQIVLSKNSYCLTTFMDFVVCLRKEL